MTQVDPQIIKDPLSSSTNTATFGLSKDLTIPISVKICYLQPSDISKVYDELSPSSEKYSNPLVFQKLSNIYINSDLFVTIQVFGGTSNPITIPVQTPYQAFTNNKREWNRTLKLPINYNQLTIDSYLRVVVYEVSNTRPVIFGIGNISLFNKNDSTLRRGSQKVPIRRDFDFSKDIEIEYGPISGITDLEQKLIDYENGEFPQVPWLDKLVISDIEKQRSIKLKGKSPYSKESDEADKDIFHLYIEFPHFELPVVYSDITYQLPIQAPSEDRNNNQALSLNDTTNTSVIINSIDIPMSKETHTNLLKVYDPDYEIPHLNNISANGNTTQNNPTSNTLDPIEMKYHKLERNINNNSLLDKELKPSPQLRDELMRILRKPSNIELSDVEKNLIWKFRYYFSKNNSTTTVIAEDNANHNPSSTKLTRSGKLFLPKFLKSINWDNDFELDHAFNEIIPNYWSVDKIQIGDALELLGNYFNPHTLTSRIAATPKEHSSSDQINNEERRYQKIFKYVIFLRKFAVDRLKLANGEEILLYLLQLVQALKYESIIFDKRINSGDSETENFTLIDNNSSDSLLSSPLATFLIEKSVENENLGNFFYWYVKVENEDQINVPSPQPVRIYSLILNKYIENLKKYSEVNKLPNYNHLKRQIWFIKKLTNLVELLRTTFKKNEATIKKVQFLREYLANSSNDLYKFPEPFPLPLDPSIIICGCYPEESSVFKSSLAPLKITFKTITNYRELHQSLSSQLFGKKHYKYGKYSLMFKIGDDLRQDQLVIQIINLMDQLLKNENLDLRLTPYRILATSPIAGLIQFVPNETLDAVLARIYPTSISENIDLVDQQSGAHGVSNNYNANNGILNYLKLHSRDVQAVEPQMLSVLSGASENSIPQPQQQHAITSNLGVSSIVMDNYVKSCAGYCVITYLLGVGDRHLDNLLLSPNGKFWHADFGYILGRDPKPFPPLMKLPIQVIDGMGGLNHENFDIFKNYCFITYTTLRKNSNLILNLFQLMLDANIPDIQIDPNRAVEKVQEKFCLEMSEEEAILHFQNLINDSVNAFLPVVIDRLHSLAQYWRA